MLSIGSAVLVVSLSLSLSLLLNLESVTALAFSPAEIAVIQSSGAGDQWRDLPGLAWGPEFESTYDVTVDYNVVRQEILGFGGAHTDTSAYNFIEWMNSDIQRDFLEALWGSTGLQYTIGRVSINSCDFSFESRVNYDDVPNDWQLQHFDDNVTYDQQRVIPFLKAVQNYSNNAVRLFASPWSPPAWMKGNNDMIDSSIPGLKPDSSSEPIRATWAAYIVRWLQAYNNSGLSFWGLTPQNEPMSNQEKFESCVYDADGMLPFIRDFLGPQVKAAFPSVQIIAYDHNKLHVHEWMQVLYGDATCASFIDGTGVHWYDDEQDLGLSELDLVHELAPSKFILGTENGWWGGLLEPWRVAELYEVDIIADLNHWVAGWLSWNTVVLTGDMYPYYAAGPNHTNDTQAGDPMLFEFNSTGTQRLVRNPSYWVLGHFSRFARPGSHVVSSGGEGVATSEEQYNLIRAYAQLPPLPGVALSLMAVAFLGEDNATVSVVVANPNDYAMNFKLRDATAMPMRATNCTIPAHAIQTYSFPVSAQFAEQTIPALLEESREIQNE